MTTNKIDWNKEFEKRVRERERAYWEIRESGNMLSGVSIQELTAKVEEAMDNLGAGK